MQRIGPVSIFLALVATLLGADLSEASVRKCRTTRNGLQADASAAILVLNGQILGTLGVEGREPRPGDVFMSDVVPTPEDVVSVDIVCLEVLEGGQRVGRQAVAIVTRAGAVEFARSHLQALAGLQEEHRTLKGSYATSLVDLHFFDSRAPLPIELTAHPDGWLATVELNDVGTSCQVHGGSPPGLAADQPPNVAQCVTT